MKLAFLGNPVFSLPALDVLHKSRHEISFILTSPDRPAGRGMKLNEPPVKIFGINNQIKTVQVEKITRDLLPLFSDIDAGIVVASVFFIPSWLINLPRFGFINLHPSLLPRWRGPSPAAYTLLKGDTVTGVSIIRLTSKIDAGPILSQESTPVSPIEYRPVLEERLSKSGALLLLKTLDNLENGFCMPEEQDESQMTYAPLLTKETGKINFSDSAADINNQIRALTPWPGCFTGLGDKLLKITAARVHGDENLSFQPGTVYQADREKLLVACGSGSLEILRLQLQSRKETDAWAFICGYNMEGVVLGFDESLSLMQIS